MPKLVKNGKVVSSDDWLSESVLEIAVDADLSSLSSEIENATVIAIAFSTFMDGRGFSIARTLREQYDYNGEIRAIGHFIADQLHYLSRCGFNAFQFEDDVDTAIIEDCIQAFTQHYQAAVDDPQPLFRKRA